MLMVKVVLDRKTTIFQHDIQVYGSNGIVSYDISKNKAEHRIENDYFGNSCFWRMVPESGKWTEGVGLIGGGQIAVEYNTLPEDMHFSLICGDLIPDQTECFSLKYILPMV
jgi:hypothetical protein